MLELWRTGTMERDNENPALLFSETVRALSAINFSRMAQSKPNNHTERYSFQSFRSVKRVLLPFSHFLISLPIPVYK